MNQQLFDQARSQEFSRKSGFTLSKGNKRFFISLVLLFVGVNLLVVVIANLFNLLGK